jgi:DNA-directed RNA polymerase subunit RPC12/RpoP
LAGPDRYAGRLFWLTLLFMGPLGIAAALIMRTIEDNATKLPEAPAKRKIADGRRRFTCPKCGTENDIQETDRSYDCWCCGEHRTVQAKSAAKTA